MAKNIVGFRTRRTARQRWSELPGSLSRRTFYPMSSWEGLLDTRSAGSPCSGNERSLHGSGRLGFLLASVISLPALITAQLNTGIIEGTLRASEARLLAGEWIC